MDGDDRANSWSACGADYFRPQACDLVSGNGAPTVAFSPCGGGYLRWENLGAVGTFAQIPPQVEAYVCRKSGLKPAPVSNQIVQRDRHAYYFSTLALIASSLEKFAVEIRHLQRTEVQEAEEPFTQGQKGSSAMPHKRNPILSENVSGLARLMRSY